MAVNSGGSAGDAPPLPSVAVPSRRRRPTAGAVPASHTGPRRRGPRGSRRPVVRGAPAPAAPPEVLGTDPGTDLCLGVSAVVHRDRSTGEAPEIRIARAPMHGLIVLQNVALSTKHVQGCPVVTAPARPITCRPAAGFTGQDEVTFDVVDPATGRADLHPVTIAVGATAAKP